MNLIGVVLLSLAIARCSVQAFSQWNDEYYHTVESSASSYAHAESSQHGSVAKASARSSSKAKIRKMIAGLDYMKADERAEKCTHAALEDVRKEFPNLSSPSECARTCRKGEPPKTCYYKFVVEYYTVNGLACQLCTPNTTNLHCNKCQCVSADGVERTITTVNRMVPGPPIELCEGDYAVIDVENRMRGSAVTIHWHGLLQNGYQYYDGVPFVTQCPIAEDTTFRYQWTAANEGTHFWHAHSGLHKLDGMFGTLIVRQPQEYDPNGHLYDADLSKHVMLINDWLHAEALTRFPGRLRTFRGQGPDSILINGMGRFTFPDTGNSTNTSLAVFTVQPNLRYRFRLINAFCTTCPGMITIEGHNITAIASDGVAFRPVNVTSIVSFAGERYDFILNANQPPGDYWIQVRGIGPCGNTRIQQLAILRYEGKSGRRLGKAPSYDRGLSEGVVLNPLDAICDVERDDAICVSNLRGVEKIEQDILRQVPDMKIYLPIGSYTYDINDLFSRPDVYQKFMVTESGAPVATIIDGISFKFPPSTPLVELNNIPPNTFCNDTDKPPHCREKCDCSHMINIPQDAIVEIILVDELQAPNISHPFHLHGHTFRVIGMGRSQHKNITKINLQYAMDLDRMNMMSRCFDYPPAKDTVSVPNNGYVILRFRANNPGYWLFHCHFLYHQMVGMDMVLHVGDDSRLPPVPENFPKCGNFLPPIKPAKRESIMKMYTVKKYMYG